MTAPFGFFARRAVFLGAAVPLLAGFPVAAGATVREGSWGGLDARGQTAQVTVASGEIIGFYWGGDYQDGKTKKISADGRKLEFTFANGSATIVENGAGVRITIRERGQPVRSFQLGK